ncbi:MAG: 3-hydroxyacyl-ACP dehydratase FabZ [Thermacetogeniaceae bacterium]|jgi:3-hydroxyacyl-[acyl-carrier-protein] dehydratase
MVEQREILSARQIQDIIPHRYPFLLVDRIVELEEGKRAVGIKNVTINESFFQGHFPGNPVMPGVLVVEAMAQVGAVALLKMPANAGKMGLFAGIDKCRFRQQVRPGDQLRIEVEFLKMRGNISKAKARALVGDKVAAEGEFLIVLGAAT